jgi:uncharacterized cupin superfamily protein
MQIVNQSGVPWEERRSPKGRFHLFRRHLSEPMGAPRGAGVAGGGHPFDVEMTRLAPGAANFPLHAHSAQWELYIILSGSGEVRAGDTATAITAGDVLMCPPGEAHQLRNTGQEELIYYVIADNPPADVGYYPDSQKWAILPQRIFFRMQEVPYYEDEE